MPSTVRARFREGVPLHFLSWRIRASGREYVSPHRPQRGPAWSVLRQTYFTCRLPSAERLLVLPHKVHCHGFDRRGAVVVVVIP